MCAIAALCLGGVLTACGGDSDTATPNDSTSIAGVDSPTTTAGTPPPTTRAPWPTDAPPSDSRLADDGTFERLVEGDMIEVSLTEFSDQPTSSESTAATELTESVTAAVTANGWDDIDAALADGYRLHEGDLVHYVNTEHLADGEVLEPTKPEYLIYIDRVDGQQGEKLLAGVMFLNNSLTGHGPQEGGTSTLWHYHDFLGAGGCVMPDTLNLGRQGSDGSCVIGERSERSAEMLHVWLVDNAAGPFASSMILDSTALGAIEGSDPEGLLMAELAGETDLAIRSGDMFFDRQSYTSAAGERTIGVLNSGLLPHRVEIEQSDALTLEVTGRNDTDIAATDLEPGQYVLFCSLPGHRAAGMEANLFVN